MRIHRLIPVLFALTLAVCAKAIPGVLIVQEVVPNDRVGDPNVAIGNVMASELEKEGIMASVVWSQTDPIFRSAVESGMIKDANKVPDLARARQVADKLKLEYIIFIRAYQFGNNVMGRVILYKGTKQIWKDPQEGTQYIDKDQKLIPKVTKDKNGRETKTYPKPEVTKLDDRPMSVMGPNGLLLDDSALSLVRTWVALIKSEPFKGQGTSPRISTPDAAQGQQPKVPSEVIVPPVGKVDNKQLLADLDAMIKSGQSIPAILMLRDAVDAEPQDVDRRTALVRTLLLVGQAELAAIEARRAAELLPDKVELRAMAARAWMQAGREDEAMADLNEAVARDPNSRETRLLLAEVNLSKGRPQQAIEHLDAVLKEKPTADTWYKRALCNALLGKKEEVTSDLANAKALGLGGTTQESASRYGLAMDLVEKSMIQIGGDIRTLMQRAQVKRTDPEVAQGADKQKAVVAAWAAFLSGCEVPTLHRSSHDRRLLASNLLSQTLGDLGNFIASNDEDVLSEARINLGEAIKQNNLAASSYKTEVGGTAKRVAND